MTETASLAAALAMVQAKLPEVKRKSRAEIEKKTGGKFSYTYANLAEISSKILPLLGEHGLSFTARPTLSEGKMVLAYSLLHVSGEREKGEYLLRNDASPQLMGGLITYARRQCLCAVTGLAPEEDDDDAAQAESDAKFAAGPLRRRRQPESQQRPAGTVRRRPQQPREDLPPLPGEEEQQDVPAAVTPGGDEAAAVGVAGSPGPAAADPPSAAGSVTKAQLTKLGAIFTEYGFTREERDQRLTTAEMITGRELTGPKDGRSSANLSRHEASALIDTLEQIGGRDALTEHLAEFAASRDQGQ